MSGRYHAIVWIDHQQAKIFQFDATDLLDPGRMFFKAADRMMH